MITPKTDMQMAKEVAKMLLDIKAVTFRFNPPYVYTTGLRSPIYTDNRRIMSFPDVRRKIVNYYFVLLANTMNLLDVDYLSGTATAGIPLAAFVAEKLDIPMVYVRASSKGHGLEKLIEGYLEPGKNVVVIEDMYSTGKSSLHNVESIRKAGGIIKYSMAVMSYELPKAKENFQAHNVIPLVLTTGETIVDTALKEGVISQQEKNKVMEWLADPQGWSKKHSK